MFLFALLYLISGIEAVLKSRASGEEVPRVHFVMLFQEHFYDAASSTRHISWHLKTVQRKARLGSPK